MTLFCCMFVYISAKFMWINYPGDIPYYSPSMSCFHAKSFKDQFKQITKILYKGKLHVSCVGVKYLITQLELLNSSN